MFPSSSSKRTVSPAQASPTGSKRSKFLHSLSPSSSSSGFEHGVRAEVSQIADAGVSDTDVLASTMGSGSNYVPQGWSTLSMTLIIRNLFIIIFDDPAGPGASSSSASSVTVDQMVLFTIAVSYLRDWFSDLKSNTDYFEGLAPDLLVAMVYAIGGTPAKRGTSSDRDYSNKRIIWSAILSPNELDKSYKFVIERHIERILDAARYDEDATNRRQLMADLNTFLVHPFVLPYLAEIKPSVVVQCYLWLILTHKRTLLSVEEIRQAVLNLFRFQVYPLDSYSASSSMISASLDSPES